MPVTGAPVVSVAGFVPVPDCPPWAGGVAALAFGRNKSQATKAIPPRTASVMTDCFFIAWPSNLQA